MADTLEFTFGDLIAVAERRYPGIVAILGKPGVWAVVEQALREGPEAWNSTRLEEALRGTEYYRTTPVNVRNWDTLLITDPATASQQAEKAGHMVTDTIRSLGMNLTWDQVMDLTGKVVTNGWDQQTLKYNILTSWYAPGIAKGPEVASGAAQYRALANQYGLKVSDDDALDIGRKLTAGQTTLDEARQGLAYWSTLAYPALKDHIDNGGTVQDFAQPFLQLASSELGISTTQMEINDPKWSALFLGTDDKGTQKVLSFQDTLKMIRNDPAYGYDTSANATKTASQFAAQLQQKFGVTG